MPGFRTRTDAVTANSSSLHFRNLFNVSKVCLSVRVFVRACLPFVCERTHGYKERVLVPVCSSEGCVRYSRVRPFVYEIVDVTLSWYECSGVCG